MEHEPLPTMISYNIRNIFQFLVFILIFHLGFPSGLCWRANQDVLTFHIFTICFSVIIVMAGALPLPYWLAVSPRWSQTRGLETLGWFFIQGCDTIRINPSNGKIPCGWMWMNVWYSLRLRDRVRMAWLHQTTLAFTEKLTCPYIHVLQAGRLCRDSFGGFLFFWEGFVASAAVDQRKCNTLS